MFDKYELQVIQNWKDLKRRAFTDHPRETINIMMHGRLTGDLAGDIQRFLLIVKKQRRGRENENIKTFYPKHQAYQGC